MDCSAEQALVRIVARDILQQIAPYEVPLYEATSAAYFADPARALKAARTRDAALGFGTDPFSILFTPLVLQVVSEIVPVLGSIAKKTAETVIGDEVSRIIKGMFKRFHDSEPDPAATLSHEQLAQIHLTVIEAGKKLKLPSDKARTLADAVIVQFVVRR